MPELCINECPQVTAPTVTPVDDTVTVEDMIKRRQENQTGE